MDPPHAIDTPHMFPYQYGTAGDQCNALQKRYIACDPTWYCPTAHSIVCALTANVQVCACDLAEERVDTCTD